MLRECGKGDLNPHDRVKGHPVLSLARLPIPPFPQVLTRYTLSLSAPRWASRFPAIQYFLQFRRGEPAVAPG